MEQFANGAGRRPGGVVMRTGRVVSDSVPETSPVTAIPEVSSVALNVPVTCAPVWVSCQVIRPGPDASDTVPANVPEMLTDGDGDDGVELFDLQPMNVAAVSTLVSTIAAGAIGRP